MFFVTSTFVFVVSLLIVYANNSPKLLVLLIDGLRYDSVDDETLVGFKSLKNRGVTAHHLTPNFPSVGYPNYFSLITGLYPEQHGITDDFMYDYENQTFFVNGLTYGMNDSEPQWNVKGEPFWKPAVDEGRNISLYWWQGCNGLTTMIPMEYCRNLGQQSVNNTKKSIMQVVKEFHSGLLDIAMIHIDEVDFYGHFDDPHDGTYMKALKKVDSELQLLEKLLEEKNLQSIVNVVVLSVYGFGSIIRPSTVIDLRAFLPEVTSYPFIEGGAHVALYPPKNKIISTFNRLYGMHRHMKVYWKWNMPKHWRIRNGPHLAPILVVADPGWVIALSEKEALLFEKTKNGFNGYDPDATGDVWGIFIAAGPSFKKKFNTGPIRVVDIYNLLCTASGIVPGYNEGDVKLVQLLMKSNETVWPLNVTTVSPRTKTGRTTSTIGQGTEPVTMEPEEITATELLVHMFHTSGKPHPATTESDTFIEESGSGEHGMDSQGGHATVPFQSTDSTQDECSGGESGFTNNLPIVLQSKVEGSGTLGMDLGSGDPGNSGQLDTSDGSGQAHPPKLLDDFGHFNDEKDLIRNSLAKLESENFDEDDQLMELNSNMIFHMSLVGKDQQRVQRIAEGDKKEVEIKMPSKSHGEALVNVNEFKVQSNGTMSKIHLNHPKIVLKFN